MSDLFYEDGESVRVNFGEIVEGDVCIDDNLLIQLFGLSKNIRKPRDHASN